MAGRITALVFLILITAALLFIAYRGTAPQPAYEGHAALPAELTESVELENGGYYNTPSTEYDEVGEPGTFPVLHITSYLDPFVQERTFWHDGNLTVSGADEGINFEYASVRLRGRGNSTWRQGQDKRPLRLRFSEPRPMLGSPHAATDWILLADHFDRSLLRNYSALYLGGLLSGLSFTPAPRHVHLYVNGKYMGVYLLTDERDVGPGRMQLTRNPDPTISDFFLELDVRANNEGVLNETFIYVNGLPYDLRWPAQRHWTLQHVAYVQEYLEAVSYAIRRKSFEQVLELIDLDSFVDFYLVHELFKEFDVFNQLSIFMYIRGQGDARRLFMGPIWDFDLSAGNVSYQSMGTGPEYLYVALFNYWYRYLMQRPEFFQAVQARWNEIVDAEIAQMLAHVRELSLRYREEFERNFDRHPIMQVPTVRTSPDMLAIPDFMGHVEFLLEWLEARVSWMDDFFNGRMPSHDPLWALVEFHTYVDPIYITVGGEVVPVGLSPVNLQNRIMVPLCELEGIFGLDVSFDPLTGGAVFSKGDMTITHYIGDLHIVVDGERADFGMPASLMIGGYAFMPMGVVSDALGLGVRWHFPTRTVAVEVGE